MIPLMKNTFLDEFNTRQALAKFILTADKLSMGEKCFEFERQFARQQGRKDAVLLNSGGSANLAILQALKNLSVLKEGDVIGFSALTWSTNVMPIIQMGFVPVPVDCDRNTLNAMSYNLEERLKTVKMKAFFLTNTLGFAGDLDKIKSVCDKNGVLLLEDNCEALGTELPAGKTGNFGLVASFSFFVAHHMSTVEGGMVCTDDENVSEMLRIVRANGWDRNLSATQQMKWRKKCGVSSEFQAKYTFYDLGYNLRPTEITGFIGIEQLQHFPGSVVRRQENYLRFEQTIRTNGDLLLLKRDHLKTLSAFALPIICKSPEARDAYFKQFSGAGIEIRPIIAGNMQKQPFYGKYVKTSYDLPDTDFIHNCGFYSGNYPEMSGPDMETVRSCLSKWPAGV
jgi:CDP-4-dehydro-6-deoxyglucose reductase, E1